MNDGDFRVFSMSHITSRRSPVLRAFCVAVFLLSALAAHAHQQGSVSDAASADLTSLTRTLRVSKTLTAYANLKRFAEKNSAQPIGTRAALALGYYDFTNDRYASAAQWLALAAKDPLLADYAQFWHAQAERASGNSAAAFARLEAWRTAHPRSVLAADAADALALVAVQAGQPARTLELLAAQRASRPDLLLARATAYEKLGNAALAARDYNAIYYQHPFTAEAGIAAPRIAALRASLGGDFPAATADQVRGRVQQFLDERRCADARGELTRFAPALAEGTRDVLNVRVTACMRRGQPLPAALEALKLSDPHADAERLYLLSQIYRSRRDEPRMLARAEEVALRYPSSEFTERALFQTGNYYWARLDHARAGQFYQRLYDAFPETENAHASHWRLAWQAYLDQSSSARARMEDHLRRFRGSQHSSNALYWLGRAAERERMPSDARAFYVKAIQRFPQSYYGQRAAERLRDLGPGEAAAPEVLASIPEPRPVIEPSASLAPATTERLNRALARSQALASIGLDTHAERELLAVFQETRAQELLLAAAQLAHGSSRHFNGVSLGRRLVPQLDSRRLPELPEEIWRAIYPFVYGEGIQATAELAGLDPMLVAGLIRQESVFDAGAVSRAGAIGLMQVMPRTGRELARQLRLGYSRSRLFQPDFNLRLGTTHLAKLLRNNASIEEALAAYNAGQSRVQQWTAGRTFREPAEFVESIPFTETREYVQIVMRNREIYRSLYGSPAASTSASATSDK